MYLSPNPNVCTDRLLWVLEGQKRYEVVKIIFGAFCFCLYVIGQLRIVSNTGRREGKRCMMQHRVTAEFIPSHT